MEEEESHEPSILAIWTYFESSAMVEQGRDHFISAAGFLAT